MYVEQVHFKILRKLGLNAYIINLPSNYGISPTFNILDLIRYKEPIIIPSDLFEPDPSIETEPQSKYP